MVSIASLIESADGNEDELRVIRDLLNKENARPAIVVTLDEYGKKRRYVVAREDERDFDGVETAEQFLRKAGSNWACFGGQWLRGFGRVDEMYRSALEGSKIVKVQRFPQAKVWGK